MLKRWGVFAAFLLLFSCAADARFPRGSGVGQTLFTHVQIGGAGLVTGTASVPSANLLLARIDQYGAYKSVSGGNWQQLVTVQSMPAGSVTLASGATAGDIGAEELIGDTLTTTNLWMGFNGLVYFSNNTGASWTQTCYPAQTPTANGNNRTMGRKIAVDPANSSIAYMSTPSAAMQRTVNQGSTCAAVTGANTPAAPTALGNTLVAFDSSQSTTTTCPGSASICTKSIYASVEGTGVYHTSDAGFTWTLTTGAQAPTTHWYMVVDTNGIVWFIDSPSANGLGTARKFDGTTWTVPSFTNNTIVSTVAYDPSNCTAGNCHVVFFVGGGGGNGGTTAYTVNSGTSWVSATGVNTTAGAGDLPWLPNTVNGLGIFPTGASFDASGNVYVGDEGVLTVVPPTSATTAQYVTKTAGIEEFLANQIVTSPGTSGALIVAGWDMGCFTLAAPYNAFPTNAQHGCASQITFQHAYSIDWAAGTPATFTALVDNQQGYTGGTLASYSGPSTNSGSTWTHSGFTVPATITSGGYIGGCMTTGTNPATIMWGPTDGNNGAVAPFYSSNSGGSWTPISVSGVTQGWPFSYALNSHQCAADRVTANTFYFYNWNIGNGTDAIIKCTGTTCTNQSAPGLGGSGVSTTVNPTLKAMPGQAGYLFLGYGQTSGSQVDVSTNGFYFYAGNGGTSKQTIAGATNVSAFGFGAPFPGHSMAAIEFQGFYNHVWGIWRSIDWDGAQTWQQVGTYLQDSSGRQYPLSVLDIDGDKGASAYGVFYYGTVSGVFCGALSTSQCNGGT